MGSGAVIYVPSLIKIGLGIQKLIRGIHRQQGDLISLILFFQNKESRLKSIYEGNNQRKNKQNGKIKEE
jgi:hypothetical protein